MMSDRELKYYDLFLKNNLLGHHYRIELSDGKTLAGVPKAYSVVNLETPTFFINGLEFFLQNVVNAKEMSAIIIHATKQLDGYTCGLEPKSKAVIKAQLPPELAPVASVFISYEDKSKFERIQGSIWEHIVEILTSLSVEKLQEFGGVVFVDTKTMEILFEPSVEHV